jgi:hypothetical protein
VVVVVLQLLLARLQAAVALERQAEQRHPALPIQAVVAVVVIIRELVALAAPALSSYKFPILTQLHSLPV